MKPRQHDPRHLDVAAFASQAGRLEGQWRIAQMARVHDLVPPVARDVVMEVQWSVEGEHRRARAVEPEIWLHLVARATVWLECQRCLDPVPLALEVDRWFRFVRGDDAAAQLDSEIDDDVLELSRSLDLHEFVEDELLLALPIVPRHEQCMHAVPMAAQTHDEEVPAANPFARLAELKRGSTQ